MCDNKQLTNARANKNDEFYTQLTDIKKNSGIIKNILKTFKYSNIPLYI